MDQNDYKELYDSIKLDNLVLFSTYVIGNENISFGRFPILSLCYLFKAKKIIKKFKDKLNKISNYNVVSEVPEISFMFSKVAGKRLRLYVGGDTVTPIEMLAILGKDKLVKKNFNEVFKSEITLKNLKIIYSINGQSVELYNTNIKISKKKLTRYQKRKCVTALILSISILVVVLTSFVCTATVYGLGTTKNPFHITSERQLLKAFEKNKNYIIEKDIVLSNNIRVSKVNASIDGNNKTINISEITHNYIIEENNGTIKNLNVIYEGLESNIESDLSLFININNGVLDNINIKTGNINIVCVKNSNNDLKISGVAITNNDTISNCKVEIMGKFTGTGNGDCYLGGIAVNNSGKIENCVIREQSNLETFEVDVCGIVCINEASGKVVGCKNYASIFQTCEDSGWSPNVAGVVLTNHGIVDSSYNYGDLKVTSNATSEEAKGNVFLGGIVAFNYGNITQSLNDANLDVYSKRIIVYCGGITAYSTYKVENQNMILPTIGGCGVDGNISITNEYEKGFVFAGGLSGYIYGSIINCYSLAGFTQGNTEDKYFIGTCFGSAYLQYQIFSTVICLEASNVYVLEQENVLYQMGSLINNGTIVSTGLDSNTANISTLQTREQIESQSVYWK